MDASGSQKPQYSPRLASKMAKNISPESGEMFLRDGLFQYKNCFPPVFAVSFFLKMLEASEIHTFFQKIEPDWKMLKMHKFEKLQLNISPEMLKMHKMYTFLGKVWEKKKRKRVHLVHL